MIKISYGKLYPQLNHAPQINFLCCEYELEDTQFIIRANKNKPIIFFYIGKYASSTKEVAYGISEKEALEACCVLCKNVFISEKALRTIENAITLGGIESAFLITKNMDGYYAIDPNVEE